MNHQLFFVPFVWHSGKLHSKKQKQLNRTCFEQFWFGLKSKNKHRNKTMLPKADKKNKETIQILLATRSLSRVWEILFWDSQNKCWRKLFVKKNKINMHSVWLDNTNSGRNLFFHSFFLAFFVVQRKKRTWYGQNESFFFSQQQKQKGLVLLFCFWKTFGINVTLFQLVWRIYSNPSFWTFVVFLPNFVSKNYT